MTRSSERRCKCPAFHSNPLSLSLPLSLANVQHFIPRPAMHAPLFPRPFLRIRCGEWRLACSLGSSRSTGPTTKTAGAHGRWRAVPTPVNGDMPHKTGIISRIRMAHYGLTGAGANNSCLAQRGWVPVRRSSQATILCVCVIYGYIRWAPASIYASDLWLLVARRVAGFNRVHDILFVITGVLLPCSGKDKLCVFILSNFWAPLLTDCL